MNIGARISVVGRLDIVLSMIIIQYGGHHCYKHICSESDCLMKRDSNSKFCLNHRCQKKKCTNNKGDGLGGYCLFHHKCEYGKCKKHAENTFCNEHKCSKCTSKVETGKTLCSGCILKMSNEIKA